MIIQKIFLGHQIKRPQLIISLQNTVLILKELGHNILGTIIQPLILKNNKSAGTNTITFVKMFQDLPCQSNTITKLYQFFKQAMFKKILGYILQSKCPNLNLKKVLHSQEFREEVASDHKFFFFWLLSTVHRIITEIYFKLSLN